MTLREFLFIYFFENLQIIYLFIYLFNKDDYLLINILMHFIWTYDLKGTIILYLLHH